MKMTIFAVVFVLFSVGYWFLLESAYADRPEDHIPQLIVEHDGVKVWRLGRFHSTAIYFSTPSGDVEWEIPNGKTTKKMRVSSGKP